MIRTAISAVLLVVFLAGCAEDPPKKEVRIEAPGVKVDVQKREGKGVEVDIKTKK